MTTKLKFACICRVSTEQQEKKGESLKIQHKQLEDKVKELNGTVYKWYEGQEHATPNYERKMLEQLIIDAQDKKFEAVMVADEQRWSRDNTKSMGYLEDLRECLLNFSRVDFH